MIVYHGSDHIIEAPVFRGSKRSNDYGLGFYLTEHEELAKEWACSDGNGGYANRYELDTEGLSVLNLNHCGYSILNWLAVLAHYRSYWQKGSVSEEAKRYLQDHFFIDPEAYDMIIGYRADDSYFTFAQDFVSNVISYQKLSQAMRLGKLGEQIVLKSERAFQQIRFLDAIYADAQIYYEKKVSRDREARRAYRNTKQEADSSGALFMLDILREGVVHGDARL